MFTKTKLAVAAALVLGAASAVQASDHDNWNDVGGYRTGPMGQHFGGVNPVYHRSMRNGGGAFAFVPGVPFRHYRTWDRSWGWER
jgi:opacity protein-like surface antigen